MPIALAALFAFGSAVTLALALGRAAARGDADLDWRRAQARELAEPQIAEAQIRISRESYAGLDAGLAPAHATISREPSMTVPSSRSSVGTQALPVSSRTSRRPRVRLNMPGNSAKP